MKIKVLNEAKFNTSTDIDAWNDQMNYLSSFKVKDDALVKYTGDGEEFIIPQGIKVIESKAFQDCTSLKSIVIPDGVKRIENCAFANCTSLESVEIPNSVEEICFCAFDNCESLKSVTLSNNIKKLTTYIFSNCGLESVTIPGGVEEIGEGSFEYCNNLESVIISEGVKKISAGAFYGCPSLKSIQIPSSLTEIERCIFSRRIPTVVCHRNSYAERYASTHGWPVEYIEED